VTSTTTLPKPPSLCFPHTERLQNRRRLRRGPPGPVREQVKYGVDVIKILASGGVLSKGDQPGAPQYTLEELKVAADTAHQAGRKIAAHAHGTQSIKWAIEAGIDSIEHASLVDDEGIALAKAHGTYFVMDIYDDDYILQEGPKIGMSEELLIKERASDKPSATTSAKPTPPESRWPSAPMPASTLTATTPAVPLHGPLRHDPRRGHSGSHHSRPPTSSDALLTSARSLPATSPT
jgi:hypothetical protein